MRIETVTLEYEHCGECPHPVEASKDREMCGKEERIIPDVWGEIPSWCPLEKKEG